MKTNVHSAIAAVALLAGIASAQPVFEPLGLASTLRNAGANGISADGSVIVGVGNGPFGTDTLSYRWMESSGPTLVPPLPGFTLVGTAGVSGDGRIIVGVNYSNDYVFEMPFVWPWVYGVGPSPLPLPTGDDVGFATAISRDGSTIVGMSRNHALPNGTGHAIVWRSGAVMSLGALPPFTVSSALGVSGDGSVIVGELFDPLSQQDAGFRWTAAGGMELLTGLAPNRGATVSNVSDDGRVVVGAAMPGPNVIHAARWRAAGPPEDLGSLPGFEEAQASGVSADGRIIVGYYSHSGVHRAFVHSDQTGMVDLTQFLTSRGVNLQGWVLEGSARVTPDGNYLIGDGSIGLPQGNPAPWRVHIPGVFCYANCDASAQPPVLNAGDFACFLNKFAAGDSYANCDGSTTAPVLNVLDFGCFLNRFAAGCP